MDSVDGYIMHSPLPTVAGGKIYRSNLCHSEPERTKTMRREGRLTPSCLSRRSGAHPHREAPPPAGASSFGKSIRGQFRADLRVPGGFPEVETRFLVRFSYRHFERA